MNRKLSMILVALLLLAVGAAGGYFYARSCNHHKCDNEMNECHMKGHEGMDN